MIVYLNGRLRPEAEAHISIHDHGFLYGDGVYETLRVHGGVPLFLQGHLERLAASLRSIRLKSPLALRALGEAIAETARANRHSEGVVRLSVTRGSGPYGFDPRPCGPPTVLIVSRPFHPYPAVYHEKGLAVALVSVRRNHPRAAPPGVKSTSCLNGILAKMEATDMKAQEGLMMTLDGNIAEGTVTNVFVVQGRRLMTPPLDGRLLGGVTRGWIIGLAREAGYSVLETPVRASRLWSADEMFLTNTTMNVMPVGRLIRSRFLEDIDGLKRPKPKVWPVGPVTRDLMARAAQALEVFRGQNATLQKSLRTTNGFSRGVKERFLWRQKKKS